MRTVGEMKEAGHRRDRTKITEQPVGQLVLGSGPGVQVTGQNGT